MLNDVFEKGILRIQKETLQKNDKNYLKSRNNFYLNEKKIFHIVELLFQNLEKLQSEQNATQLADKVKELENEIGDKNKVNT